MRTRRKRRGGHLDQTPSKSQCKKKSKIYRSKKDKSPEEKGSQDNLRLKKSLQETSQAKAGHSQ